MQDLTEVAPTRQAPLHGVIYLFRVVATIASAHGLNIRNTAGDAACLRSTVASLCDACSQAMLGAGVVPAGGLGPH